MESRLIPHPYANKCIINPPPALTTSAEYIAVGQASVDKKRPTSAQASVGREKMKKSYLLMLVALIATSMHTQSLMAQDGEIRGIVKNKTTGDVMPFIPVGYYMNGSLNGTTTDGDGFYKIKPLPPGTYTLKFSFTGFDSLVFSNVLVRAGELVTINAEMVTNNALPTVIVKEYKIPLIPRGGATQITTIAGEDIDHAIDKDPIVIASKAAGVFSADDRDPIFIRGSRASATKYIVDGIPVRAEDFDVPGIAIEQVSVITGGVPAMFGDATGGIIIVTTKSYKGN